MYVKEVRYESQHEYGYHPFMGAIEFCAKKVFAGCGVRTNNLQKSVLKREGKRIEEHCAAANPLSLDP